MEHKTKNKEASVYDKAYDEASSLWSKVEHKKIHKIIGNDIFAKLNEYRDQYVHGRILNIGCGTGENIRSLLLKNPIRIMNLDISLKGIQKANKQWGGM